MFNRWNMQPRHPAFAWSGPQGDHEQHGRHGRPEQHGRPDQPGWGQRHPGFHGGGPAFGPALGEMLWQMRGRGFGGRGGPHAFGRGDLKYQLLTLLTERPKHGYEMIKELETQAGGFYTPSAGAVYPSLQLMEDREWITSRLADGKKVHTITEAGRQALAEHQRHAEETGGPRGWGRFGPGAHGPRGRQVPPELAVLREEAVSTAKLLWAAVAAVMAAGGDPAQLTRLQAIVSDTRQQLEAFLVPVNSPVEPPQRARGRREGHGGPGEPPVL
ncbi:MAG: PadR family transcriptional regulator [Chloroflexota bacterium]|nr:PadR family transcriptional regulator [Chloroflexota bacterium]